MAVGGPCHCGVVVGEVPAREETGAVGKAGIVLGEALIGCCEGGDVEDRTRAKAEGEDRAVAGGESCEGEVGWLVDEVEVAEDGNGRGAWW